MYHTLAKMATVSYKKKHFFFTKKLWPPQLLELLRKASRTYDRPIQHGILLLYSKQDTTLDVPVISTRLFLNSIACQQPPPKPFITGLSVAGGQHPGSVHWDGGRWG